MNLSNYDTIYFNGSSFTEGGGFEAGKWHIHKAYKEKYGFEYKNEKEVCYPTIVQNLLPNIKVINEAKCGAGTERVIRKVWEYIFLHRLDDVKKTIFILELPGSVNRLDLFSNKEFKHLVGTGIMDFIKDPIGHIKEAFAGIPTKYNNVSCLLTTHFINVCKKLKDNKNITNFHMDTKKINDNLKYLYTLKKGISEVKGGLNILSEMNYPKEILDKTMNN
jgi:hypothetical protein